MTADELRGFEEQVAQLFNDGQIRSPVHLESGNEEALITYFKGVHEQDWVAGSWRMHLKCLLHGVNPVDLLQSIMDGRSISLCFPDRRIISSAMVGGILPIATGIALGIKRRGENRHVHCFLGDMTALTGTATECIRYAHNFDLPITFVIEDNDVSVCTPTKEVWGFAGDVALQVFQSPKIYRYSYQSKYPHSGAGKRIEF